jgi:hypothetical protein
VLHCFAFLPAPRALGGLGRTWLTHTLQLKEHAACWYFQAPLYALVRLRARLEPQEIAAVRRITCGATLLATAMHGVACRTGDLRAAEPEALRPNVVNLRLDASLALLWLRGRLTPAELAEAERPEVARETLRLAERTEVTHRVDLSRATVAAVHEALDVPALLGAGPLAVVQALVRAGREFQGAAATAVTPRESAALAGELLGALRRLRWSPRHADEGSGRGTAPDPLGDPSVAAAVETLALPCGGAITVELEGGGVLAEQVDVPAGAALSGEPDAVLSGEPGAVLARRKLEAALRATGRAPESPARAAAILEAVMEAPLDTPVRQVLALLHR